MPRKVHLIGIAGTAMATLAAMLQRQGHQVQGSDQDVYPPMSTFLERERVHVLQGYRAEHLDKDVDVVVVGNAVSRGNPEVEEMLDRRIRHLSLPEAVREHFLWQSRPVVVAGTHGKTTTTAMTAWLLTFGGLDPGMLVGGIAANFGDEGASYRLGNGGPFVIEGDEYDSAFFDKTAKFLKYVPEIAVVGNVEFDHADIYEDLAAVQLAFRRLVNIVPRRGLLLVGADSPHAMELVGAARSPVQTFGLAEGAGWSATSIVASPEGMRFDVSRDGRAFGAFDLPMAGTCNVRNALAAIAVGAFFGLDRATLIAGLAAFAGVRRRLELVGVRGGVAVYDDFAHHPTAVAETLAGLRAAHPGRRIVAIFEPRSATSCRRVFQEAFAHAFSNADRVVVAGVYRSTLDESIRLSPERLVEDLRQNGQRADFIPGVDAIVERVSAEASPGDLIVVMSNGGFGGIHGKLLASLGA